MKVDSNIMINNKINDVHCGFGNLILHVAPSKLRVT